MPSSEKNNYDEAAHSYETTVKNSTNDKPMQEKGYYNQGVAMIKQKKLQGKHRRMEKKR